MKILHTSLSKVLQVVRRRERPESDDDQVPMAHMGLSDNEEEDEEALAARRAAVKERCAVSCMRNGCVKYLPGQDCIAARKCCWCSLQTEAAVYHAYNRGTVEILC